MLGAFQGDDDQRTPEAKAQDDITNFANSESAGFSDAEIIEPAKKIEGTANGKVKAPF